MLAAQQRRLGGAPGTTARGTGASHVAPRRRRATVVRCTAAPEQRAAAPGLGLPAVDWSRYHLQVRRCCCRPAASCMPRAARRCAITTHSTAQRRASSVHRLRPQPLAPCRLNAPCQVLIIDADDVLRGRMAGALFERIAEWNGYGARCSLSLFCRSQLAPCCCIQNAAALGSHSSQLL